MKPTSREFCILFALLVILSFLEIKRPFLLLKISLRISDMLKSEKLALQQLHQFLFLNVTMAEFFSRSSAILFKRKSLRFHY